MSFVKEGTSGSFVPSLSIETCNKVSYRLSTLVKGGAKSGGAQITHAGSAFMDFDEPLSLTEAVTGPSETSSCQSLLLANAVSFLLRGDDECPNPPSTINRPSRSVFISPSGTISS